ncbi:Retrovirus-related Pol polyprotein from transposon [Trichinella patagoniensis]|uniref:Retrovirus-related Pol polyprotein from transposon n=1 Tax=Trichinella patagoniensis TaxID=990121 RepID=A0A0V0ZR24_9BILA|nr:Retrovirus-related Pol polyprotein from transposon [Trichinella patagoniensis]KRY07127.1 Retrovirus-related Pol polyprotein from transposon [Trichinella patagoniensis]KRY14780.1 Retrovirus-related Pol polyprotein from transposon [Trichinella patagoniensis]
MLSTKAEADKKNWDLVLPVTLLAYRRSVQESTGATPYRVLYGREATLPIDLMYGLPEVQPRTPAEYIPEERPSGQFLLQTESRRQKKWYDRRTTDCHFDVNDKVWLAKPKRNKLDKIWDGPYRIVQQAGYKSNPRKQLIVHVDGLKRCYGTNPEIANRSDKTEEQHRSSVNEGQRSHNVIVTTSTGTQRRQNEQITPTNPQPNLPKRIPAKTEMAERLCYGNRTNSLRQTAKKNGVV